MYFIIAYAIIAILTARCGWIWIDGENDWPAMKPGGVFISVIMGMFWPPIWIIHFIMHGFSNPLKPWR